MNKTDWAFLLCLVAIILVICILAICLGAGIGGGFYLWGIKF